MSPGGVGADLGEPKLIWRAKATTAFAHLLIWPLSFPASTSFNGPGPMLISCPEKQRSYRADFCFLLLRLPPPPPLAMSPSSLATAPSPFSCPSLPRRAGSDLLPTDMDDVVAARWLSAICGRETYPAGFVCDYNLL